MTTYPSIPLWVQHRILGFFNYARNVDMILDGTIQDDPTDGSGSTIGPTLAARILRVKSTLPRQRFTELTQLDAIRGIGPNTLQDLVYSFGTPAATAFRQGLYDTGTLYPNNWALEAFRCPVDASNFQALANDPELLRTFVSDQVAAIAQEKNLAHADRDAMLQDIRTAYIDHYSNSTPETGYALALWFYQFDADNWFSWERIQEHTLSYFEHHMTTDRWSMDLYLFRGFTNRGLVRPGIAPTVLPIVVNWAEEVVTIFGSGLYD